MDTLSEVKQTQVSAAHLPNSPTASSNVTPLHGDKEAGADQSVPPTAPLQVAVEDRNAGTSNAKRTSSAALTDKCTFYVKRKRRNCNAATVGGRDYCVEHSYLLGDPTLRKRIVCPLDSKHSCYEDHLKAHLKRCNAREVLNPVCYVGNINSGEEDGTDPAKYRVTLRTADEDEVSELLDKVRQLCEEHIGEVRSDVRFHPVLQEEASKLTNGPVAQKHIQQQASLISHMDRLGLLADHRCFIEFGAGKGGLSHWVQLAAKDYADTRYLLIDRGSNRYKKDSYHKGEDQGPSFERLKMDIEHLDLGKVPSIQECTRPIVGFGKHLCGAATDLMLRCLNTLPKEDEDETGSKRCGRAALGIVLALCCHHRCEWRSYVGKASMDRWGLSARQFHLMCCLSSWAVCGSRPDKGQNASNEHNAKGPDHPRYSHIPVEEREKIGYQCKRLINLGRVAWLREQGYEAETIQYIDSSFSLENVALLATRKTGDSGEY